MSKIELPAAPYLTDAICKAPWTVDDIVRSYGKACARAALERAAQICDEINSKSGGGWETFGEAIRAEIERD